MFCPNCGSEVMEDAKFCPSCGLEIKLPGDENRSDASSNGNPKDSHSNEKKSNITSEDVGKAVSSASSELKKGAIDFKNEWSTWSTRKKFFSLIACCCIGWLLIGVFGGGGTPDKNTELFDETNQGLNISLVKESTSGYAFISSDGDEVYDYSLKGVLINIPSDSTGFTVRSTFLDDSGKSVGNDEIGLDYLEYSTENSEPTTIASIQKDSFENISSVKIVILNPKGETVFEQTVDFDMDDFDLSRLDEKNETTANDSADSDSVTATSSSDNNDSQTDSSNDDSSESSGMTYVGSINSDKFHYPSCSQADRIKDSNKITFSSREDAVSSGYSPCGICNP